MHGRRPSFLRVAFFLCWWVCGCHGVTALQLWGCRAVAMRQPHFGRCAFVYRQGFVCFLLAGVCLSAGVAFHFTPAYYPTSLRDSVLANLQFASGEEGICNSRIICRDVPWRVSTVLCACWGCDPCRKILQCGRK